MSTASTDLASLSREALINRVLDLQAENNALSRQLRSSGKRSSLLLAPGTDLTATGGNSPLGSNSGLHSDPHRAGSSPGNRPSSRTPSFAREGMPVSPAAARLSIHAGPKKKAYEISMSVMVIDNGSALSVPMSSVLDKTYGREDVRDADTPVVSSKYLRDIDSVSTQRFSVGSSYRHEGSVSMNLDDEFAENGSCGRPSGGDGAAAAAAAAGAASSSSPQGRGSAALLSADGHPLTNDDDDEPAPKDPSAAGGTEGGAAGSSSCAGGGDVAAATALAQRAGVMRLNLKDGLLFQRDLSLDADALISLQTLRLFNQQYNRDCNILSPLSSYGNAVYHYVVKTFAVRNGCQHSPDDVEGFGRTLISLCKEVKSILKDEPRHGSLTSPCYVFGDLHGNFRDLFYFMDNLISFQDLRYTPHRFLFLGDYVDRGEFSVEVVAYLFAMKVLAPHKVLLLRGNHEDTLVSGDIGGYGNTSFRAQCHGVFGAALGEELWRRASETFAHLPLTANIDNKIYCTHGGIPRYHGGVDDRLDLLKTADFPVMESFFQVPERETPTHQMYRQIGMDTCWADPAENESKLDKYGFGSNPRGTGVILFGTKAVDDFLDHFDFEYIFRAHQEKSDGLKLSKNARVFTIFSTSAYVGHQNGAGVVLVADGKIRLIIKNADLFEDEEVEEEEPNVGL